MDTKWTDKVIEHCQANLFAEIPLANDEVTRAWLAGLLEGEGSFMMTKNCPSIAFQITDKDIAERVAKVLDVVLRSPWKPKGKPTYKQVWSCRAPQGPLCG